MLCTRYCFSQATSQWCQVPNTQTGAFMCVIESRMGRMLIRMVCSRDVGIGSNLVPYTTLVVAAVTEYYTCASCQQQYILLGLIVQCSMLMSMGSILVQPRSQSSDDDILMQVRKFIDPQVPL